MISIHAPTRGATTVHRKVWCHSRYFNPRSYKRSDNDSGSGSGGTSDFNPRSYKRSDRTSTLERFRTEISIHAPTRGATCSRSPNRGLLYHFNPRSYKRSDFLQSVHCLKLIGISIHAPTRGATRRKSPCRSIKTISIHAPTRGATIRSPPYKFQASNFNPRSYKRSDGKNAQLSLYLSVIIIA